MKKLLIIVDKRIKTFIINNAGAFDHQGMASVDANTPVAIVYGNNGMERPNSEADYNNESVKAPACLIMMDGADHGHGSGPWDGMAATVAWFRWHLGGEDFRKADFVELVENILMGQLLEKMVIGKDNVKIFRYLNN